RVPHPRRDARVRRRDPRARLRLSRFRRPGGLPHPRRHARVDPHDELSRGRAALARRAGGAAHPRTPLRDRRRSRGENALKTTTLRSTRLALVLILLAAPLGLAALPGPSPEPAPAPSSGRWILDFDKDGWLQLTMKRRSGGHGNWTSSDDYKISDFHGL